MYRGYMAGCGVEEAISFLEMRERFWEVGISLLCSFSLREDGARPWIEASDVVIHRPGVDARADRECEYASSKGILVLHVGDRSMEMVAKIAKAKLEERR